MVCRFHCGTPGDAHDLSSFSAVDLGMEWIALISDIGNRTLRARQLLIDLLFIVGFYVTELFLLTFTIQLSQNNVQIQS